MQLRDIENTLDQKTKTLESVHNSISSNTNSATEDVSVSGAGPANSAPLTGGAHNPVTITQTPGSPLHPSPRQHSLTMEGVQRIADKVAKHTRVEEAAIKRIRDLEMQVTQMRDACVVSNGTFIYQFWSGESSFNAENRFDCNLKRPLRFCYVYIGICICVCRRCGKHFISLNKSENNNMFISALL